MKLFNDISTCLERYYLGRDFEALEEARRILDNELADPTLQEEILTIAESVAEVDADIKRRGFFELQVEDTTVIKQGKFIRVKQQYGDDDSCMVLMVAHISDTEIVLVPGGGA
jgi:hypothetical protein